MTEEEKTENPTDSMIEEEVEETSINAKHRPFALGNLIGGYVLAVAFASLVAVGMSDNTPADEVAEEGEATVEEGELVGAAEGAEGEDEIISLVGGKSLAWPLGREWIDPGWTASIGGEDMTAFVETMDFVDINEPGQYKVIYTIKNPDTGEVVETKERFVTINAGGFVPDNDVFVDRSRGVLLDADADDLVVVRDDDDRTLFVDNDDRHLRLAGRDLGIGAVEGGVGGPDRVGYGGRGGRGGDDIDVGILDRRLAGVGDDDLLVINDADDDLLIIEDDDDVLVRNRDNIGLDLGGNDDVDAARFELDEERDGDAELGDVGDFAEDGIGAGKGDLPGIGEGSQVYAYNFPSQGVGAGIGNPGVGAAAGFAGIGAGIGQAVLDGQAVPTLGGIGSYAPAAPAPAGPDGDGDAIPDALEAPFRTNPKSNDTDGDGASDADEVRGLSNPLDPRSKPGGAPAPGGDADGDGVPASLEALYGLNPANDDTDGDGFNDGEELAALTNPSDPASNPGETGGPALAFAPGVAGGVGGLVNGAGSGAAAGLVSGQVSHPLGLGIKCEDCGDKGCGECAPGHPPGCDCGECGGHGHGVDHGGDDDHRKWDHLPPDGNLFIMMYVDESGSILPTRKALEEMRDGLMKEALLPYYLNDESLYNRRVQIVGTKEVGTPGILDDGERSLEFFSAAAKKENVLALAFQDEGSPSYHLPTFNKKPEDHYLKDLNVLRNRLNGFGGVYRGVMFQVDRGRTFAKSFKEFVENAWQGGSHTYNNNYLSKPAHNLKRYYWQENRNHIRNHSGVVFSDEYHLKSDEDPTYYIGKIFEASRKVGLDLGRYGGGLEDGRYNAKISEQQ